MQEGPATRLTIHWASAADLLIGTCEIQFGCVLNEQHNIAL